MNMDNTKRFPVTVMLSEEDFSRLTQICKVRGQSRADFLRGAIGVHEQVPVIKTRPLSGACLERHLARLEREKVQEARNRRRRAPR